ncbi:MAG: PqqD family protein [Deltaproteobacteria bacterium]|nr:PqqD family protein [Deltaproteobacteria bacterium]
MKPMGKLSTLPFFLALIVFFNGAAAAEPLRYAGQFFDFTHHRLAFVDIIDKNNSKIGPLIIDKKGGPQDAPRFQQYALTETGAFILRLVLQEVDPEHIKRIYMSEYNVSEDKANTHINKLIDNLTGKVGGNPAPNTPKLLKNITKRPKTPGEPGVQPPSHFGRALPISLDVDLNQMGGGGYKIPPR